jgi:hypothetical protein
LAAAGLAACAAGAKASAVAMASGSKRRAVVFTMVLAAIDEKWIAQE